MKFSRDNWEHVKIRGVVEVINGTTPKGFESFGVSGEYPFFKVSDMNLPGNEIYMENHTIGLNTEEVDKYKIKLCPKDTIIFPKRGASIYTNKKRILINSAGFDLNTMGFVPKECLNPYYLFVWFQTIDLGDISDGSYIPQINNKNIDILEIPLPPFEEQQCIAELFQSIDVVIKEVEKQETKLKLLQKALITSLTSKEPTFGNLLNYNNYKVLTYGNIVDCIEQHDKEKINVSRFIGLEHIEPENLNITTWADIEKGTTFTKRFSKGDILFGKRRDYLKKVAVADFDGICSGDILVLRANPRKILPELLPFYISSEAFIEYAVNTSAGSLSPRTKWRDLSELQVSIPDLETQEKILEIFTQFQITSKNLTNQKNTLRIFKQKLLMEIFG